MTRYGIDADVAIRLVRDDVSVPSTHQLVGPNRLRSDVLAAVYRARRAGDLGPDDAAATLEGITALKMRLLGDRVSRRVAWQIADQLDWPDIGAAEYVAVAKLQADAFVTLDADLAGLVDGIVPTAPFAALAVR